MNGYTAIMLSFRNHNTSTLLKQRVPYLITDCNLCNKSCYSCLQNGKKIYEAKEILHPQIQKFPSFREFAVYASLSILESDFNISCENVEYHIKPQSQSCNSCILQLDFILKVSDIKFCSLTDNFKKLSCR